MPRSFHALPFRDILLEELSERPQGKSLQFLDIEVLVKDKELDKAELRCVQTQW